MRKLLVFQHIEREHPSNIALYSKERGIALDIVPLWKSQAIPALSDYDGLVILGGSMGVYEEYPGKAEELHAIRNAIGTMPVLGICLGSQLLAHALGAEVYKCYQGEKRIKEVGYYPVALTEKGKASALFGGFPETFDVLQWHGDTFDIPNGAELLAEAPLCRNQAFSYGNAYGVQFHIEATPEIVRDWIEEDAKWTHEDFEMDEEKAMSDAKRLEEVMRTRCYRMMDNFLG